MEQRATYGKAGQLVEGWYFTARSKELKKGKTKHVSLLGKDFALYRGYDGVVRALDAYCPHMGAHLAEGDVDGNGLRCHFHNWKFSETGELVDVPCKKARKSQRNSLVQQSGAAGKGEHSPLPNINPVVQWPCEERYGLIWLWTGETAQVCVPEVPELAGLEVEYRLAHSFKKECHPNVMMINAIDEQHFASVHPMAGGLASDLEFDVRSVSKYAIEFSNQNRVPRISLITRFLSQFYSKALTYSMRYHFGTTGTVTLGPDFLHFYILFTLKPTEDGKTIGQTVLLTKKRSGLFGKLFNKIVLRLTHIVGNYFARGDDHIFKTIKFKLQTPVPADHSIVKFVNHFEKQTVVDWEHVSRRGSVSDRKGASTIEKKSRSVVVAESLPDYSNALELSSTETLS